MPPTNWDNSCAQHAQLVYWHGSLTNFLPGLVLNCDPPDLCFSSIGDYSCEPLGGVQICLWRIKGWTVEFLFGVMSCSAFICVLWSTKGVLKWSVAVAYISFVVWVLHSEADIQKQTCLGRQCGNDRNMTTAVLYLTTHHVSGNLVCRTTDRYEAAFTKTKLLEKCIGHRSYMCYRPADSFQKDCPFLFAHSHTSCKFSDPAFWHTKI
jgi:hypothetical protein